VISDSRRRLALFALLAASVFPYFTALSGSSIWDANEAFYVETPREMIERGDYIGPTFNYQPRFNKPVLSYWIVAAFYKVFGVSVGVQRIPIALGAVTMIFTAFLLARAGADPSGPARPGRSAPVESALWAALGLAVDPRLMMFGRRIFIDIYISMFMALTLLFFALAERYPGRRRLFLLAMYATVGLGMLTKGPVAAALPALVFAIYLAAHGELKRVREMMIPAGILVVLAIVLPWYVALYHRYGWTYITSFFVGENIARYTEGLGVETRRGPLFYLPVVFSDSFPWSLCLFGAAGLWLADWRARRAGSAPAAPPADAGAFRIRTLLWLWVLVVVVFFTFSAAKQDLYIFPIVPAVAALGGLFIARNGPDGRPARPLSLRVTAAVIALLLAVAGTGTLYIFQSAGKVYALDGAMFVGCMAAAGGVVALLLALLDRSRAALATVVLALVTLNWGFVIRVLPSFERYKPVPRLSAAIRERLAEGDVVAHYNVALPSMVFYLGRHIDILFERDAFLQRLRSGRTVYAVLSASDYAALQPSIGVATCVLDRQSTVNVKLKAVLAREPLPEVLLITNKCGDTR
jgi:4-amino-4-deoxy-L-arabinose transferase-like glycosyltransferase